MFKDYRFRAAAILLVAAFIGGAALLVSWLRQPDGAGALIGGPFELTDQTGARVTNETFRGKLMLIYFGYVFCPDACPTALQNMADAIDQLGPAGEDVVPVFITIDPARDTVEVMKDYAEAFPSAPEGADRDAGGDRQGGEGLSRLFQEGRGGLARRIPGRPFLDRLPDGPRRPLPDALHPFHPA